MRVLVTGAHGFLGRRVCQTLREQGFEPIAFVRRREHINYFDHLGIAHHCGSLLSSEDLAKALSGVQAVLHLAGGGKASRPSSFVENNVLPTVAILKEMKRVSVKRLVLISSLAATGPSLDGRLKTPLDPLEPISLYGRSKAEAERLAMAEAQHLNVTIIRPPTVYGPRDWRLRSLFMTARRGFIPVFGGLPKRLCLLHVQDCAEAIVRALQVDLPSGTQLFIDDGEIHDIRSLAEALSRAYRRRVRLLPIPRTILKLIAYLNYKILGALGRDALLTPNKADELLCAHWICDSSESRRLLAWHPKIKLEDGIAETARWYQDKGS